MSVSIHVGAHKTATTHLTNCIDRIERQMIAAGTMFLGPESLRHAPLNLRALLNRPDANAEKQASGSAILRGLIDDHRNLVISEEQILGAIANGNLTDEAGRVYPKAGMRLRHLLDLIGTRDVTVFLACRSPADFLTSAFGEYLRHNGPLRIEDFLGDFDPRALRWSELAERLMQESGAARMICWRYEDLAAIRPELLRSLLGPDLAAIVPDLPPTRLGLSDAAYRALLAQSEGDTATREMTGKVLRAMPKQGQADRLRALPQALHDECDRLYAADCARIAAMPAVRFLSPPVQG
ncbi:hypothetical protein FNJ84_17565 [Paracoccus sp. M683]|uniref:hypothetical protein n=1 Tax=Paracoccus sp. M683 TaxID=2594268 RepID=UPI00117C757D|nr:hypothetical protein [Paracoccus sp. M683]TRW95095.1 hypothetical protein FNJ84_17565 [Paracoccus sp. M683]